MCQLAACPQCKTSHLRRVRKTHRTGSRPRSHGRSLPLSRDGPNASSRRAACNEGLVAVFLSFRFCPLRVPAFWSSVGS